MKSIRLISVVALLVVCVLSFVEPNCLAQTLDDDDPRAIAARPSNEPSDSITSDTLTSSSTKLGDLVDYRSWMRSRRGSTPIIDAAVRMNTTERDVSKWRDRAGRSGAQPSDSRYSTQSVTAEPDEEEGTGGGGGGLFGSIFGDIAGLSGTQAELRNVRNRMSQLVSPLQNLREPIGSLRDPINQLSDPISKLEQPLHGIREPISNLKQPLTDLKQPMSDLRQPLTDLRQPMLDLKEGLQRPMAGLQKPLSDLNLGTRQLSAPLNRMTGELDQLQRPMSEIGQPLQKLATPINGLPEPIHSLSGSVSALKSEVNGLHSELGDLRQSILDISRNISFAIIVASFVVGAAVIISRKVASRQQPTKTFVEQVVEDRDIDMAPPEEHSHLSGPGPYDIAPAHGHGPILPPSIVQERGHGRRDHVVTIMKTVPIPEDEAEREAHKEHVAAEHGREHVHVERGRGDYPHGHEHPRNHERIKGEDRSERDRYH